MSEDCSEKSLQLDLSAADVSRTDVLCSSGYLHCIAGALVSLLLPAVQIFQSQSVKIGRLFHVVSQGSYTTSPTGNSPRGALDVDIRSFWTETRAFRSLSYFCL